MNEMVNRWKKLLRWRRLSADSNVIFVAFEVFELPDFLPRFFLLVFGTLYMFRVAAVLSCLVGIFGVVLVSHCTTSIIIIIVVIINFYLF